MLKTDYKNDVYDGNRKYRQINNSDGTISLTDETVYTQEGDMFSGEDMNDTNKAVNALYNDVIVTVPATFSSSAPYSVEVAVANLKETDPISVWSAVEKGTSSSNEKTWKKMASMISYVEVLEGKIRIVCNTKKPTESFKIKLSGVSAE